MTGTIDARKDWPWRDLAPADFVVPPVAPDSAVVVFPEHTLTPAQVAAIGAADAIGGIGGITLEAADGTRYSLVIRPQLAGLIKPARGSAPRRRAAPRGR